MPARTAAGKSGIFEAVLSSNLSHPNIVHTYQYAFRPVTVRAGLRCAVLCRPAPCCPVLCCVGLCCPFGVHAAAFAAAPIQDGPACPGPDVQAEEREERVSAGSFMSACEADSRGAPALVSLPFSF